MEGGTRVLFSSDDTRTHTEHLRLSATADSQRTVGSLREIQAVHTVDVLGELKVSGWRQPELPGGFVLRVVEGVDAEVANTIYEGATCGDAESIAAALGVSVLTQRDEGEEGAAEDVGAGEEEESGAPAASVPEWRVVDVYGYEPLAVAAAGGHLDAVRTLLSAGASASAASLGLCETALHRAAKGGFAEIVVVLLGAGADANAATSDGLTPLAFAARAGRLEACSALLSSDAVTSGARTQVDRADVFGNTPLMLAAKHGHVEVAKLLIDHHAFVDAANSGGWRPVHFACQSSHEELATLLSERGASLDAKTKGGRDIWGLDAGLAEALHDAARVRAEQADACANEEGGE